MYDNKTVVIFPAQHTILSNSLINSRGHCKRNTLQINEQYMVLDDKVDYFDRGYFSSAVHHIIKFINKFTRTLQEKYCTNKLAIYGPGFSTFNIFGYCPIYSQRTDRKQIETRYA